MNEDVTLHPTEDTSASENNHPQASDAASLSKDGPSKSPEEMKDTLADSLGETSTNDAIPAHLPESEIANKEPAVKLPEDAGQSEEALPPSDEVSAGEEVHNEGPAEGNMSEKAPQASDEATASEETPVIPHENTQESEIVPANATEVSDISEGTPAKTAEVTSSSELTPVKAPARTTRTEPLWLNIVKRVLVGIVLVLTLVGLLVDMAQLVGV